MHFHCHVIPRYAGAMENLTAVFDIAWPVRGTTNLKNRHETNPLISAAVTGKIITSAACWHSSG
jgi:diadenosine tetraphosphate (Ap4A) HIT family hydrolase